MSFWGFHLYSFNQGHVFLLLWGAGWGDWKQCLLKKKTGFQQKLAGMIQNPSGPYLNGITEDHQGCWHQHLFPLLWLVVGNISSLVCVVLPPVASCLGPSLMERICALLPICVRLFVCLSVPLPACEFLPVPFQYSLCLPVLNSNVSPYLQRKKEW